MTQSSNALPSIGTTSGSETGGKVLKQRKLKFRDDSNSPFRM